MQESGVEVKELNDQPEMFEDLIIYWRAFNILSTSRQSGFGLGYIPFNQIVAFLDEERIVGYERGDYVEWIQTIDKIYVKVNSDQQKSKESKAKKKHKK